MPKFLENALRHEGKRKGLKGKHLERYVYGGMNSVGAMRGNKETAKGAAMERKHESDLKKGTAEMEKKSSNPSPDPRTNKSGPKMEHMRITPAENGGHVIEHHFAPKMKGSGAFMERPEMETHVFGPGDGAKMLGHLKKHLCIGAAPSPKTEEAEMKPSEPIDGGEQGEYESDEEGE
jgi:hypothetical protein